MEKIKSLLILSLLVAGARDINAQYEGTACILKTEFIYQASDVPFPSCHASTIIETGGELMAAWFGGTAERNPDVGIWISKTENGSWTKPLEAANGVQYKEKRYPCWNPVLFNAGSKILLFYKVGPSPSSWWGEMKESADGGKTWSRAYRLPEGIIGPVKNKPELLDDGTLLCPSSTEDEGWRLHMEMTKDFGLSWERTGALNDRQTGAIQPSLLLHPGGRLQLVCRSTVSNILSAWSDDMGRSWTTPEPLSLPNPNSGIDAVTLKDGRHLLIYNHLNRGRHMLHAAVSSDGKNWEAAFLLENEPGGAEFSYPAVIQSSDGKVHITYTWNRKLIRHVVVDPEKIRPMKFTGPEWPR
jgi:predicted neuraminidase